LTGKQAVLAATGQTWEIVRAARGEVAELSKPTERALENVNDQ